MSSEILIVDDEADIRDLVAGILQDENYSTRTARNSDDALWRPSRHGGQTLFFLISGCRAASWTACNCWMRSSKSILSCRS